MAKRKRGGAKAHRRSAKPAKKGSRRRGGALPPVPAPHPIGWRGAGAARVPGGPPPRDPTQDEEDERPADR